MKNVNIKIFVNQLGNLKILWEIPTSILSEGEGEIKIQLPSFKYDLPKIAGLPVPFSSKAIKIEIKNISLESYKKSISYSLDEDFEGNNVLKINTRDLEIRDDNDSVNGLHLWFEVPDWSPYRSWDFEKNN